MRTPIIVILSAVFLLLTLAWVPSVYGDIVIEGDDWESFFEQFAAPGTPPPEVAVTQDGLTSLHMTRPSGDKYVTYKVNVTQLPAGETRFAVKIVGRQVQDFSNGLGIRNLSIDPELDPSFQSSFIAVLMNDGGDGGPALARDEIWLIDQPLDTEDVEGQDPRGSIGQSGLRVEDPTLSTEFNPPDTITTANATLDLQMGENLLRIDATDPRDLPVYAPDCGWQAFSITIGEGEADLQGEVLPGPCLAERAFSTVDRFEPGSSVTVTLNARNIPAGQTATLTDTFPRGWSVSNAGGGVVSGNTIAFNLNADGERSYELSVPNDFCEAVTFDGTLTAADCDAETVGDSQLTCFAGGILIGGDDWENFIDIGADQPAGTPAIVDTVDDPPVKTIHFHNDDNNPRDRKFALYALNVTRMPAGRTRFPVVVELRTVRNDGTGLGFYNATIDPNPPPLGSWIAMEVRTNEPSEVKDSDGNLDPRGTVGGAQARVEDDAASAVDTPFGLVNTAAGTTTFELQMGLNFIFIEPIDPGPLPGALRYDPGFQVRSIRIGPGEQELEGEVVAACNVRRALPSIFLPGDDLEVNLAARNISGATTITETIPAGMTVSDNGGGQVNGNTITFQVTQDGSFSYALSVPADFCRVAEFRGNFSGPGDVCEGDILGASSIACATGCDELRESGAVPAMLIIGPIDAGGNTSLNGLCDDNGNLGMTDYLTDGNVGEEDLEVIFGDEIAPEFGGAAGGVGVALAPNQDINPDALDGVLTVWLADTDANGLINFNDPDNLGDPLDDYIIYGLVYLDNTTDADLPVVLEVGSDDAVKVLVNGEVLWVNSVCRGVPGYGGGDRVPVTLAEGINTVLIAVVERGGGTAVRLVVRDELDLPIIDGSVRACLSGGGPPPPTSRPFVRGDTNADGVVNITDGVFALNFLFLGGPEPPCREASDTNGDNSVNITDAVYVLNFLFLGGPEPPAPFGSCAPDPDKQPADVDCGSFEPCDA